MTFEKYVLVVVVGLLEVAGFVCCIEPNQTSCCGNGTGSNSLHC